MDCDRCGECCARTSMQLSLRDIRRLEKLGYKRSEFCRVRDGFNTLRNDGGLCYFFDKKSGTCRIYPERPEGCTYYPIMYSLDDQRPVLDEDVCQKARTITRYELDEAYPKLRQLAHRIVNESRRVRKKHP